MKQNRSMKKLLVGLTIVLAMAMLTVMVQAQASEAPEWWDNPNDYSTWNRLIVTGNASNDSGNAQSLFIFNDNILCTDGATRDLWMQISWVNTGSPNVSLRNQTNSRGIEWTEDAAACPATVTDPLPSEDGDDLLNSVGAFTPSGNSVPSDLPFTDGFERSFSFDDTNATCARTTTAFNIPDGGGLEYQIEIQTVCFTPTAVNLGTFTAVSNGINNVPQAMGVVALLLLVLLSFGFVMVRRQSAQS
jgi:hypothetical protein